MANLLPSVYLNRDIKYLRNANIVEFDIKSAGLSILRAKRALPESTIDELLRMPKEERNVTIGLLEHNNVELSKLKNASFPEYITRFVRDNNINLENILSIKKDAIFLINCDPRVMVFDDYVVFEMKNVYTSYCLLNNKEFYYNSNNRILDSKGLGQDISKALVNGPFKDISNILGHSERSNRSEMFRYLKDFRSKYLNKKLPVESYRDIETGSFKYRNHNLEFIDETYIKDVDHSTNWIKYYKELVGLLV